MTALDPIMGDERGATAVAWRAAAAGSANEKENGAGGGGTETDATGGSPAVPTVSIDQLLG